jgi:hypothetical protein
VLAEIRLTEQGDGTVLVTMSEEFPISITTIDDFGARTAVDVMVRQSDLRILVSGDPGEMHHDVSAASYAIEFDQVAEDGQTVPVELRLALNNLAGTFVSTGTDLRDTAYDMTADTVDVLLAVDDAAAGTKVDIAGTIRALGITAETLLPVGEGSTPEMMFAEGLDVAGGYEFGGAEFIFEIADAGMPLQGTLSLAGGHQDFAMNGERLSYSQSAQGVDIRLTSAEMPFPIVLSAAEFGLGFLFPTGPSEEPADFGAVVNLTDLAVNDEIWGMLDPAGALPRTPATAVIDLAGKVRMLADLTSPGYDPAEMIMGPPEEMMMGPPAELHALTLNELTLSFGGARITGTGAFTFDNADLATFGGMPRPQGEANVTLTGVNGLLDRLVQLGILPTDQLMMVRGMLGFFAIPAGDDVLTSKFEVTPEGAILANGMPLQ